jgi:branched-chain amino acid transport system substrate-binding protein
MIELFSTSRDIIRCSRVFRSQLGERYMKRVSLWFGCAGTALLLAACASDGGGGAKPAPSGNEIVIGVAGPMSGDLGVFGEQISRGAEQAVADLNAQGGVLGKQVRLVEGDDQCDPPRAVRVAQQLVDQGVVFVAGHFCSGSSIPASEIYAEEDIVQMTPASTNPKLTERAAAKGVKTLFRATGRDDKQGTFAGRWLAATYGGGNVAILDDRSPYGQEVSNEAQRAMEASGLKAALRDTYTQKQRDFSSLIAKLKAANIVAVYVGGYHNDIGLLVRQAREQGFTGAFASVDALNTAEFWSISGPAGEGVRYTDGASAVNLDSAKKVVAKFRADGYEPEGYVLNAYAAVQAWAAAATIAQSTDGALVANALHTNTVPTVIGDLSWDSKGDMNDPAYAWYVWDDGRALLER